MIEVTHVVSEARQAVQAAARVYVKHTRPWFVGLLLHGSAFKGQYIPGCSDIDLQLYLDDAAFEANGSLPLNLCLEIHRDLSRIDPAPFQYIQCRAVPASGATQAAAGSLGPIPGAYQVLLGTLPVAEATEHELLEDAHRCLEGPEPLVLALPAHLLDHGGHRLAADVRLLCTRVWPTLYHLLVCRTGRPLDVWPRSRESAIALLPEDELLGQQIRAFHRAVCSYYGRGGGSVDRALAVIGCGARFLREAREWYRRSAE
jgi:hypothetical protein